jgi:hypothetical protein
MRITSLTRATVLATVLTTVLGLADFGAARATATVPPAGTTVASCKGGIWADDVADSGQVGWQRSLPFPPDGTWSYPLTPAVAGRVAAFAAGDTLYGLRLPDGHTVWRDIFPKGNAGSIIGLTVWKGSLILLLGTGSGAPSLAAVNPATGAVRWRTKFSAPGFYYEDLEVTSDGVGAVLTLGDTVQAVDLSTGALLWSGSYRKDTTLTAVGSVLIIDSKPSNESPSTLQGVVARTGRTLWASSDFPNAFTQLPGPDGVLLGYGSSYPSKTIYPVRAISAATGQLLWQLRPAVPVDEVWASAAGVLVTAGGSDPGRNPSSTMYFADPETGQVRWSAKGTNTDNGAFPLITATDVISVASTENTAAVVDRYAATGTVRWTATINSVWLNRYLTRPTGRNVLVSFPDAYSGKPAQVLAIDAATGRSGATSFLPATAAVEITPAVAGSQALFEPAWWSC